MILNVLLTAVVVIAGVFLFVLSRSQADDASQSTVVGNAAPTVDTVTTAIVSGGADQSSITLTEGTTRTIYIHGVVTDENGCQDANNSAVWQGRMYRTNHAIGFTCSADSNDCYTPASITLTGCTGAGDLNLNYEGTFNVDHYADATDSGAPQAATTWTVGVRAKDASNAQGNNNDTFELSSLLAADATTAINYGTLNLGNTSGQQTITITATGNRAIDLDQTASGDMVCNGQGSQNIPAGNVHLSFTDGFSYGTGDQSVTALASNIDLSLAQRINDASLQTKNIYARVLMPSSGVYGTCSNSLTFVAKVDS